MDIADWWMVGGLLEVEVCAVGTLSLQCFTKDWVEGLVKYALFIEESYGARHHRLHPLHRISLRRSIIKVVRVRTLESAQGPK